MQRAVQKACALLLMTFCGAALSEQAVHQPLTNNNLQFAGLAPSGIAPFGQSFSQGAGELQSIDVYLSRNFGAVSDPNVTMSLYEGSGFSGSLLATSTLDAAAWLGAAPASGVLTPFAFSGVQLSSTLTYSFKLTATSLAFGADVALGTNPYAGGQAFFTPWPMMPSAESSDLRFTVNVANVSAVPEPRAEVLGLCGVALLSVGVWRRKRAASVNA